MFYQVSLGFQSVYYYLTAVSKALGCSRNLIILQDNTNSIFDSFMVLLAEGISIFYHALSY